MTLCPECGSVVPEAFAECQTCGEVLNGMSAAPTVVGTCGRCGEEIARDADACPACGDLRVEVVCARHAERLAEGQCVVCGRALCEECNEGGQQHYLCAEHSAVPVVQGWAEVYSTADDLEANLIRENLQAEGVDARVLSQKDHFSIPVDLGDFSPVRVLVPAYAYSDAAHLIAEHMDESGEVAFGDGSDPEQPRA